jgi:GTPase SAR1 family protein
MRLLAPEAPRATLAEYEADARRGDGRLVLVAGEAGVGKSALVEELRRDMPGARWSWGACDGLVTPRPLVPPFDPADQLGGDLLDRCLSSAPQARPGPGGYRLQRADGIVARAITQQAETPNIVPP